MRHIYIFSLLGLLALNATAADVCNLANPKWTYAHCATIFVGASASAVTGVYSVNKYRESNSIDKNFTETAFANRDNVATPLEMVSQTIRTFGDGDRITIYHQMSEKENRKHHIGLMDGYARSARASQAANEHKSRTLMQDVYTYKDTGEVDEKGNAIWDDVKTGEEADTAGRAQAAAAALEDAAEAKDYEAKAKSARNGGPVPIYEFIEEVAEKKGTVKMTNDIAKEKYGAGGKVVAIERLPADKFALVKSGMRKAHAGAAGAVLGFGFAAEEAFVGEVANGINKKTGYSPRMSNDYAK